MMLLELNFTAALWVSEGTGAWHFLTLPHSDAQMIRSFRDAQLGFGTVRVLVTLHDQTWATSLFPDKASQSYFLPIKAAIRKSLRLNVGDSVSVNLIIQD